MQTQITAEILQTADGQRANEILRKCVHCGFCTATCPTYQLLGDELDGPRGRIYLIKQMLEGQSADSDTLSHFDRCLTCRSCETTCPSGVDYAELIDIGRHHIEKKNLRPVTQRFIRALLGAILPYPSRHKLLFHVASKLRRWMPQGLKHKAPAIRPATEYKSPHISTEKTVLLLQGCAQSTLSPNTNAAAELVLRSMGYQVIREKPASCCGAVNHHLNQPRQTHEWVLNNLKQWHNMSKNQPIDFIVSTATGCGIMLKDYPKILGRLDAQSKQYETLISRIRDISELLDAQIIQQNIQSFNATDLPIAYHAPCTLTHGHKLADGLYKQLTKLGYQLSIPQNSHLCCGSAGTYSILQPTLSKQLRNNKINALEASSPDLIITANVGCEHHLNSAANTPVKHWVELLADDIQKVIA